MSEQKVEAQAINAEFEAGAIPSGLEDALAAAQDPQSRRAIFAVPVEVVVSVGKARPLIGELINMRRDAVIMLDRRRSGRYPHRRPRHRPRRVAGA